MPFKRRWHSFSCDEPWEQFFLTQIQHEICSPLWNCYWYPTRLHRLDSWTFSAFPAGAWLDLNILQRVSKYHLDKNEWVKINDWCRGESPGKVKCTASSTNPAENEAVQQCVCNRQETVNKCFEQSEIIATQYRHDVCDCAHVFCAIMVLTQVWMENGEPLIPVHYSNPR